MIATALAAAVVIMATLIAIDPLQEGTDLQAATSGECGDGLTWEYDGNGTLTIQFSGTGSGQMTDFANWNDVPWNDYKQKIVSVILPEGLTSIGSRAFGMNITNPDSIDQHAHLRSITIPSSVTSIGGYAFMTCTELTSIEIPSSVTSIGAAAFANCRELGTVNIPDGIKSIEDGLFNRCYKLTSITIPDSVTYIGRTAFAKAGLTSITIPDSVTSIDHSAFAYCEGLTSITIPDSVTYIGDAVLSGCSNLTSVKLPDGLTSIGEKFFAETSALVSIEIPDTVTSIWRWAFKGSGLTSISIPDTVTSIDNGAFEACTKLGVIVFGSGLTKVGEDLFLGYDGFIYKGAFYDTDGTTKLTTADELRSSTFRIVDGVKMVKVDEGKKAWAVAFDLDGGKWMQNSVYEKYVAYSCLDGEDFTIDSTRPTKDEFRFCGWSYGDDLYENGSTMTVQDVTENILFKAQWGDKFPQDEPVGIEVGFIGDTEKGKITGLTKDMEFWDAEYGEWITYCVESLDVDPGKYEVRLKEDEDHHAGKVKAIYLGPVRPTLPDDWEDPEYNGKNQTLDTSGLKDYDSVRTTIINVGGTDAGRYTATIALADGYTYWSNGYRDPVTITWQIISKEPQRGDIVLGFDSDITVSGEERNQGSWTYDGTAKGATAEWKSNQASSKNNSIVVKYAPFETDADGKEMIGAVTQSEPSDVGRYKVYAAVQRMNGGNYDPAAKKDIRSEILIEVGTITVNEASTPAVILSFDGKEVSGSEASATYTGDSHNLTASCSQLVSGCTASFVYVLEGTTGELTADQLKEKIVDVGTYRVTVKTTVYGTDKTGATGNYEQPSDRTVTITINPAKFVAAVKGYSGEFDGDDHKVTLTLTAKAPGRVTLAWKLISGGGVRESGTKTGEMGSQAGKYTTVFEFDVKYVADTGIEWEATADNFEDLSSTKDRVIPVSITKAEAKKGNFLVEFTGGSGKQNDRTYTYDGYGKTPGRVDWKDSETHTTKKIVYYSGNITLGDGEVPTDAGTYTYGVVFEDDPNYKLPSIGRVDLGTIKIDKRAPAKEDLVIAWVGHTSTGTYVYDAEGHMPEASWKDPMQGAFTIVCYDPDGNRLEGEPVDVGTYTAYLIVAEGQKNFLPTDGKGIELGTVDIVKGTVKIVDFRYALVDLGQETTMTITMEAAGTLTGDVGISVGGKVLVLESSVLSKDENGRWVATLVYDTSLGDMPAGLVTDVTVSYSGDANHTGASLDGKVRTRAQDLPVIPDEGGTVPIDPGEKKTEVETPIGDIIIEVDGNLGDDPTILIKGYEAGPDEEIPGADRTLIIETDLEPEGTEYTITATIWVDVPAGMRPVVKLYDEDGALMETPVIAGYTSNSVTFSTHAENYVKLRVGATSIPLESEQEDPVVIVPTDEKTEGFPMSTLAVAIACVITLLAFVVLASNRGTH